MGHTGVSRIVSLHKTPLLPPERAWIWACQAFLNAGGATAARLALSVSAEVNTASPIDPFAAALPSAAEADTACECRVESNFPMARAASSWCPFTVCSPHVQAAPLGRRRQTGRKQLLEPSPPLCSLLLKPLGERSRHLLCLAALTVLFGTVQKPLCVEQSQAGPLGCVHAHICSLLPLFLRRGKVVSRTPSLPLSASRVAISPFVLTRGNGRGTRPFWVIDGRGLWSPRAAQLCLS